MQDLLSKLGEQLSFIVRGDKPLLWLDTDGNVKYAFHIIASAIIGELIYDPANPPNQSLIILPGGRANLVAHKLHRDPRLRQAVERGWRFVKYRQVRILADTLGLPRTPWMILSRRMPSLMTNHNFACFNNPALR
jgi:hypothetical protein